MDTINWKQKLSSRKLWAAVAAFIATIITALFKAELSTETVELIEKGVLALCVFIGSEGLVDAARLIWSNVVTGELITEVVEEPAENAADETVYEE